MPEILAIDLGSTHVGIAVGDRVIRMAFARPELQRTSDEQLLTELVALARAEGVAEIVVGLPLTLGSTDSDQTRLTEDFARRLEARTKLPVHRVDERLSSVAARRGVSAEREHSEAARLVLESYLSRP